MKKLLFIFLLFPLLVFGQAEKTHRAVILDSIKAFNGGIIDVKDTLSLDALAVYKTDLSSQYTSRSLVDSAFVGSVISGGGIGGSIIANQVAFGTGVDIIGGDVNLIWDNTTKRLSIGNPASSLSAFNIKGTGVNGNNIRLFDSGDKIRMICDASTTNGGNMGLFDASVTPVSTLELFGQIRSKIERGLTVGDGTTASSEFFIKSTNDGGFRLQTSANATKVTISQNATNGGYFQLNNPGGTQTVQLLATTSGGLDNYINSGNFGVGLASSISARLHISGINATNANMALKVSDNTGVTSLFIVRNGGNIGIGTESEFGNGVLVIAIANATTVPSANPTGGGVLYVEGGALKYRGSSGTVTTIANP